MIMNKKILFSLVSSSLLLSACGGGSSSISTPTTSSTTYSLKGTVPGTLIEAYCDNGSIYSVSSTKNGTDKHPFELKLPRNLPCRVVMITNENDPVNKVVTPIKFIDAQGNTSIVISSSAGDIEVGFIDLSLTRSGMTADGNNDGVEDIPKEVIVDDNDIDVVKKTNDPLDADDDGIINVYEDSDGDGMSNHDDNDDDNDGILDINDNDHDNDGVSDDDLDGDGVKNGRDVDDDNDGLTDDIDSDDDGDGIDDDIDTDDDNDGIDDDQDDNHNNNDDDRNDNDDRNGDDNDDRNGDDDDNSRDNDNDDRN